MNARLRHRPPGRAAWPPTRAKTRGATLIEVLVAVVVLSIGLLGLAGLQLAGLKSNHSAYMRSQATLLAYDLADRMRAARAAAEDGAYDDKDEADDDRADWDANVTALLGADATGSVERDGRQVTITIQWDDSRGCIKSEDNECTDDDSADDASFVYRTEI